MTHTDEGDAIDTWVGALRSDYQPAPSAARERIAARLAGAGLAAATVGGAAAAAKLAPRGFLYSKGLLILVTLPVGIAIGAAGHAWLAQPALVPARLGPSPVAPVSVAAAVEPPVVAEAPLPPLEPMNPRPEAPRTRAMSAAAAPRTPPTAASRVATDPPGLAHELRLLEQARTKLSEGQPAATLEQLRQHREQYPQSVLEQEREALSIRALAATGRRAEAQKRAAVFVQRYPGSVLRGSVERAVGQIP